MLFDAIEFDPVIASGDVLYDLAFLLMDLIERGLGSEAHGVFDRYLAETRRVEDFDALAALPLFLSVRAAIRAKVTAARLAHAPDDTSIGQARPPLFQARLRRAGAEATRADRGRRTVRHGQIAARPHAGA